MKRSILLISLPFFNYYQEIKREAEALGFQVDYICDRASDSNLSKAIGRVNIHLLRHETKKYFKKIVLPRIQGKVYDYIITIRAMGFALTPQMIGEIKQMNPSARFILYQWDSEDNLPDIKGIHDCFHAVYSFEPHDCEKNPKYQFLPLFFTQAYATSVCETKEPQMYDCAYIGTAHPKKIYEINQMAAMLRGIMPRQFIYHYMPSRLKYYYHKIKNREYRHIQLHDLHMQKLTAKEIADIYQKSACILDAPQYGQTGLTMRTIECCLGVRRKLITTNADIKNYDFYRPENILVFDGSVDLKAPFFQSPYIELPEELYQKYSLRNWLCTLLYGNEGTQ